MKEFLAIFFSVTLADFSAPRFLPLFSVSVSGSEGAISVLREALLLSLLSLSMLFLASLSLLFLAAFSLLAFSFASVNSLRSFSNSRADCLGDPACK